MKKISLIITVVIGTFLYSGHVSAYFDVATLPSADKGIVKITVPENGTSKLYIYDPEGYLIHNETIKPGSDNSKVYDVSNLEDGVYSFTSEMDFFTTYKKIKVESSTIEVISKLVEYRPVFSVKGDYLLINFLNLDQDDLEIVIESYDRIYHRGDLENTATYHKAFDIRNLSRGEYFATLSSSGKTFRHSFQVD